MSDSIRSRRGGVPPTPNEPKPAPTLEECLLDLQDLIENARSMPMSASVLVSRDNVLEIIDEAMRGLPEEIQRARWLIKERDQFLVEARRDANLIIESARAQAERMVERIEIVREARRVADQMVFDAESDARRLRNEAEDYVAGQLLKFEETLEDILAVTRRGRSRFAIQKEVEEEVEEDQDFFDQDYLDDE